MNSKGKSLSWGDKMDNFRLPMNFSMALALEPEAMRKFALLSTKDKWEIVSASHAVESDSDMRRYVQNMMKTY